MRVRLSILLSLGLFLMTQSCGDVKSSPHVSGIVLSHDIIDNARILGFDKAADLKDYIFVKDAYIYEDTILVMLNVPKASNFIDIVNLRTGDLLWQGVKKGRGPSEVLSAQVWFNNGELTISDIANQKFYIVQVDSVLKYRDEFKMPEPLSLAVDGSSTTLLCPYGKDSLVCLNNNVLVDKRFEIDNAGPRLVAGRNGDNIRVASSRDKYDVFNVSQGSILCSKEHNSIVFCSSTRNRLEWMRYDTLEPFLVYDGPGKEQNEYHISKDGSVSFDKTFLVAYNSVCSTSDLVFFSYTGQFYQSEVHLAKSPTFILVFNWEGEFLDSYKVDCFMKKLSVSQDGKYLYGSGYDNDGNRAIWKVAIPEE